MPKNLRRNYLERLGNTKTILGEKTKESLASVLPILGIVLVLCFSIAPIPTDVMLAFLVGAVLLIVGMGLFTLGADTAMLPIGERVGVLPNPGLRDGETFQAWYDSTGALVSTVSNLANVDKHPAYYPYMGNLEAEYVPSTVFYLYIYTNGNTDEFAKRVVYYGAPAEGTFKMSDINLYDIFPNYTKYDDKGDEIDGWFDENQWDKYCLGKPANELEKITLGEGDYEDDIYQFYIMLTDNGNNASTSTGNNNAGTGYNDNHATRDPSNPSTGDEIFVAVTVMALSAAALVLFFLNKKRIAK